MPRPRNSILLATSCLVLCGAASGKAEQGWHFKIEHEDGVRHRVVVWKDGFRVDDGTTTCIFRTKAKPQVTVISDENEAYATIAFSQYLGPNFVPQMLPQGAKFTIGPPDVVRENGLLLNCYSGYDKTKKLMFRIWTMPEISGAEVNKAACISARIPSVSGFPVRAERLVKGKVKPFIKLLSAERVPVDFSPLERIKTKKYQKVSTPLELTFCEGKKPLNQRDLDSLFFTPSSKFKK